MFPNTSHRALAVLQQASDVAIQPVEQGTEHESILARQLVVVKHVLRLLLQCHINTLQTA